MFPFFGSKGRLVEEYPAPTRGRVIEPLSDSARYSLFHRDREVWINDIDPLIFRIWKHSQNASVSDARTSRHRSRRLYARCWSPQWLV